MAATATQKLHRPIEDVLSDTGGPFVTAYLPTPSAVEDAADRFASAVDAATAALDDAGAPSDALRRLEAAATQAGHGDGEHLVVVADAARAWTWPSRRSLDRQCTFIGSVPRLAPLLADHSRIVPHLLVVLDREGADLEVRDAPSDPEVRTVSGSTEHIHRGKPGGWSQRRFQQRAENTWEHNAGLVAEAVEDLIEQHGVDIVLVAGDERASQFLLDALSVRTRARTVLLRHGGRAAGVDQEAMDAEIDATLDLLVDIRIATMLEDFGDRRANDRGDDAWASVFDALFEGLVERLFVHVSLEDDRTAYHGPEPHQVAATPTRLEELGLEPRPAPAADLAVRAAISTGAEVVFVDEQRAPSTGIGAALRADRHRS